MIKIHQPESLPQNLRQIESLLGISSSEFPPEYLLRISSSAFLPQNASLQNPHQDLFPDFLPQNLSLRSSLSDNPPECLPSLQSESLLRISIRISRLHLFFRTRGPFPNVFPNLCEWFVFTNFVIGVIANLTAHGASAS